jgi:ribosomal protein S18 acetylase RimI-like enzyme
VAPFLIRRATAADVEGVVACLRAAFEPYRSRYTPGAFADTVPEAAAVRQRLADMSLFVAVGDGGEIVGTIACRVIGDEEGHVRGMAVRPECQGTGVAQRLLEEMEGEMRARGCARLTLGTTEPLARAIAFYERNGFVRSGEVGDFHGMPLFGYVKPLT